MLKKVNTFQDNNQQSTKNTDEILDLENSEASELNKEENQDNLAPLSRAPLKSFKKSSSKKSNFKYILLIVFILLFGTAGVLYMIQQQQQTPVPTVPESEPEAAIETWCTLTFNVPTPTATPTPTPEPTPVPHYPQCHSIEMLNNQKEPISEQGVVPNQTVTLACSGNVSTQPGAISIKWMEFRALKQELCLPGEECDIMRAEQVWNSANLGDLEISGNIITGYAEYTTQFGSYALQCRVCTNSIEEECDGEWDNVVNWPNLPKETEPTPIPNVTRLPSRPPKNPTPVPELDVTIIPTTYDDPRGGCRPSECGNYRNIKCIGTETLVCKKNDSGVCAWQCEPTNVR